MVSEEMNKEERRGKILSWNAQSCISGNHSDVGSGLRGPGVCVLWLQWTNSHGLQKSCGEKGLAWPLSKWESASTPVWTGFYCFSGYITSGWSSFTMHRFTVGDYLLEITKERMLLITSKRRMLQIKGKSGWTGYTPYLGCLAQTLGS